MFNCAEYREAVKNARRLSTLSKKVSLEHTERSQTVPSAFLLKIKPDKKWSSSEAAVYEGGTVVQRDDNCSTVFSGEIQEIDPERGVILVLRDNGTENPSSDIPCYLYPVDYYKALEEFSRDIRPESTGFFTAMPEKIREGESTVDSRALEDGLREAQKKALYDALTRELSFVWGPPGTGKSYTIGRIVANFHAQQKRVLLLSTTNTAVDVATFSVDDACTALGMPLKEKELVRLVGNLSDIEEFRRRPHLCSYSDLLRQYDLKELDIRKKLADLRLQKRRFSKDSKAYFELLAQEKEIRQEEKALGEKRRIAIGALVSSAKILAITFTSAIFRKLLQSNHFDAIIVDEASQIPLAAWIYLTYKHSDKPFPKIIVAGDPNQLQPIPPPIRATSGLSADEKNLVIKWTGKSIYTHVGLSSPDCDFPAVAFLDEQSRMHRKICEAVSRTYYSNRLHGDASTLLDKKLPPLVVLECAPGKISDHRNYSCAEVIKAYVDSLVSKYQNKDKIVKIRILTTYAKQREVIAQFLCSKTYPVNIRVDVSTVHSSQGSEADVVIFDVSDELESWFVAVHEDAKYMWCVAVSRAKNQCVLVLSNSDLENTKNWHARSLFKNAKTIRAK